MAEPWQKAEIAATVKAFVIKESKQVVDLIGRTKNPILVVGHESLVGEGDGKEPIEYAIEISKKYKTPVVATAQTPGEFLKRGFQPAASMSAMDIGNRLADPKWSLPLGSRPDLALFLGVPYIIEWNILSGLKHFAPHIKTMSLDRFYQPHANFSFPNLSPKLWRQKMEEIIGGVVNAN